MGRSRARVAGTGADTRKGRGRTVVVLVKTHETLKTLAAKSGLPMWMIVEVAVARLERSFPSQQEIINKLLDEQPKKVEE